MTRVRLPAALLWKPRRGTQGLAGRSGVVHLAFRPRPHRLLRCPACSRGDKGKGRRTGERAGKVQQGNRQGHDKDGTDTSPALYIKLVTWYTTKYLAFGRGILCTSPQGSQRPIIISVRGVPNNLYTQLTTMGHTCKSIKHLPYLLVLNPSLSSTCPRALM